MGKQKKVKEDGNEVDVLNARQDKKKQDCNEILAKKRKIVSSRKAATIHASPVDSKDLLQTAKESLRRVPDSIALRVKRGRPFLKSNKSKRYDDGDNIFFLNEMVKLVGSGVDGHEAIRNINIRELHGQVSKRFGPHYTERQVYEKARRLRRMYMNKYLTRSADHGAVFESSSKEEIFNLCHQLWGDCGVLTLHLEDEDGPVGPNDRLGFSSGDAASSHENDFHGLGVVPGRGTEIHKGVHAEVDNNVPVASSIHQDDSHGVKGLVPAKDMVVDKAAHAEVHDHVPSAKARHVCLCQDAEKNPGGKVTELAAQRLDEVLLNKNQELLQALEKKCDLVLEGMQVRLMTMVSSALEARDEPSMDRMLEMLKPAALPRDDKFVDRMLTGSMHESSILIPKHLQDRWQRLRADELKLVSDRLHLMLEVCQSEQAKLERQRRHS